MDICFLNRILYRKFVIATQFFLIFYLFIRTNTFYVIKRKNKNKKYKGYI